ncbi:MAG: RNA polymerase factor sigma-54, partial [Alphaproteobacteria bacterium]|nr:RNA polymerase factor sigma-54 [Alphaproteobacteria bacterium]
EDVNEAEPEPAAGEVRESLDTALSRDDFSKADDMDAGQEDLYDIARADAPASANSLTDWTTLRSAGGHERDGEALDGAVSESETLKDFLNRQLSIAALSGTQRLIAAAVIDSIDEAGYFRSDCSEIAERLAIAVAEVEAVLAIVQGFEPTGVGARNLAECLALQLKERDRLDPAMRALLDRLDLVARRDLSGLCTHCGVDAEDILDMIAEIRSLTPKPGLTFGADPVQPVVPDVFVREGADGLWHVELNSETLPRLLVNARYYTQVATGVRDKGTKEYLTDCLNSANWLVKSLDQRARTILKVASEIVRQQDGFLSHGVRHLRPLNLRTVADAIGMHESTVSRVTSNKFLATPRGVFELKYFFTAAIQSVDGAESHSAEAVRDRIKELIDGEGREILSDDRIVAMLTADGVNIARRTVAKYREAMRIPSSVERRRQKCSGLSLVAAGR